MQLLNADPACAALLAGRLFPQEAPQDQDPPYGLYVTSDPEQEMTFTGYINLFRQSVRFDFYGDPSGGGYKSAKALAKACRDCLFNFFRGTITDPRDGSGVNVQGVFGEGGEDGLEPPAHAEGAGLDYCAVQVGVVWNLIEAE